MGRTNVVCVYKHPNIFKFSYIYFNMYILTSNLYMIKLSKSCDIYQYIFFRVSLDFSLVFMLMLLLIFKNNSVVYSCYNKHM